MNELTKERAKRVTRWERKMREAKRIVRWVWLAWVGWALILGATVVGGLMANPEVFACMCFVLPCGGGLGYAHYKTVSDLWDVKDSHEDAVEAWVEAMQDDMAP